MLEVHASYHFSDDIWMKIPVDERNKLRDEREAYKRRRYGNDQGSTSENTNTQQSVISEITTGNNNQANHDNGSHNDNGSIMGGRNEQASLRGRNPNNNN